MRDKREEAEPALSLKEMLIIQALISSGPAYGYQLAKDVENMSEGRVRLGPGTLYPVLKRLLDSKYVERAGNGYNEVGQVRKLYRATGLGSRVLLGYARMLDKALRVQWGGVVS